MSQVLRDAHFRNKKPAERPYKVRDSNGLYLLVQPNGSKLWRYRYRINGRENVFAIGDYADVGLQEARAARDAARQLIRQGIHPAHQKKAARLVASVKAANTFEAVGREWIAQNQKDWSAYYLRQVVSVLEADVFARIGGLPIADVKAAHLLSILKDVERRPAPTIAILIRQWSSAIFRYAAATLRVDHDPAVALKGAVKKPKTRHKKALTPDEIRGLLARIDDAPATLPVRLALKLLMVTFVRPGELRQARWDEFSLSTRLWRVPAGRMKMREEHVVPLSTQTIALLEQLRLLSSGNELLFPNTRDPKRPMSATTLNRCLERMGYSNIFSAHGFRATASTLLNEMGFHPDWIERQLAHEERDASRRSYNQARYLAERGKMMQTWADYIDSLQASDNVVPLRVGASS